MKKKKKKRIDKRAKFLKKQVKIFLTIPGFFDAQQEKVLRMRFGIGRSSIHGKVGVFNKFGKKSVLSSAGRMNCQ